MFSIINTRYEGNVFRVLAVALSLVSLGYADIVRDVRLALAQHNTSAAESALQMYRGQRGADPEYLEASSWVARAYLSDNQLDQADTWAKQVESSAREALKHRALDAEPHLPLALGAALEVEAQVLASRGQNSQAAAL